MFKICLAVEVSHENVQQIIQCRTGYMRYNNRNNLIIKHNSEFLHVDSLLPPIKGVISIIQLGSKEITSS